MLGFIDIENEKRQKVKAFFENLSPGTTSTEDAAEKLFGYQVTSLSLPSLRFFPWARGFFLSDYLTVASWRCITRPSPLTSEDVMPSWNSHKEIEHQHGVQCSNQCLGKYVRIVRWVPETKKMVGSKCKCGGIYQEFEEDVTITVDVWSPAPSPAI